MKSCLQTAESDAHTNAKALGETIDELEKARIELQGTLSENRLLRAQKEASDDDSLLHMGALESTGKELSALKSELLSSYKQIEMYKAQQLASTKKAEAADSGACELRQAAADKVPPHSARLDASARACACFRARSRTLHRGVDQSRDVSAIPTARCCFRPYCTLPFPALFCFFRC